MIRQLQNLNWEVPSPSHYRLVLPNREDTIDISYLGDRWMMFLEANGHVSTKSFAKLADAIGMVAQAFRNEGVI